MAEPTTDPDRKEQDFRTAVRLMGRLLIARKDVKAIEGSYWKPDRTKFTIDDFRSHFFSDRCLGTYLLDTENNVRFLAFDIDLKEDTSYFVIRDLEEIIDMENDGQYAEMLDPDARHGNLEAALHDPDHDGYRHARMLVRDVSRQVAETCRDLLGLEPLVVLTGGGSHVIVPFGTLVPASDARAMGRQVMESIPAWASRSENFWVPEQWADVDPKKSKHQIEIEVFPKQDELGHSDGLGNLLRLPLGKHRATGVRSFFMDWEVYGAPSYEIRKLPAIEALERAAETLGVDA
jgi:hypothetical protein